MGFIIAMIILSAPFVLNFFSLGWSCLVFNVLVMFLNEFSQYKYSILSFSYSCIPVPELQVSLHALVPSPIANYCCLLLCTRIIFGSGFSSLFFLIQPHADGGLVCLSFGNMVFSAVQVLISLTVKGCHICDSFWWNLPFC